MQPLSIFSIGVAVMAVLTLARWAWARRKPGSAVESQQDSRLLWFFVYLAAFCLLGYIAIVFGK